MDTDVSVCDRLALASIGQVAISAAKSHPDLSAGMSAAPKVVDNDEDKHSILLRSGRLFSFLTPAKSEYGIEDIAHGLAHECRFAGHVDHFYSVAQHSLLVSLIVPREDALCGLLHDGAEAFLKDIPKPLKRLLPDYSRIEKEVEADIFARFGLPPTLPKSIKHADQILLATERRDLQPFADFLPPPAPGIEPLNTRIYPMSPIVAKRMFLKRFHELTTCAGRF